MPRTPSSPSGNVTLSKVDLAMIDLGLAIMQENKDKSLPDLLNARDLPTHGIIVQKSNPGGAVSVWPEVVAAAVVLTVEVYKAWKSGASIGSKVLPADLLQKTKVEHNFSLDQLVAARAEINKAINK